MRPENDKLAAMIEDLVVKSEAPLETLEIDKAIQARDPKVTKARIFYRLQLLRGAQRIKGKSIGSGMGTWIWWGKGIEQRPTPA